MNRHAQLTSQKISLYSEGEDKVYPYHTKALHKAGLAPPSLLTMGDLWKMQDDKLDIDNGKESDVSLKKHKCLLLCCLITLFFYVYPQDDQQAVRGGFMENAG